MARKPIKQRVEVDYDDRGIKKSIADEQKLKKGVDEVGKSADRTSKHNRDLSSTTRQAGREADRTTGDMDGLSRGTDRVRDSIGQKIKGWLSFIALSGTIVTTVREITSFVKDQVKAVAELGKELRGLTANIGGKESAEVFRRVTDIAAENRFSVAGRQKLLEGVTSLTDARPGLTVNQIEAEAKRLATLQRATGVGGASAQQVLLSAQENLGLTSDQSVDFATAAINSGVTPEALDEIIQRGGNVGGLDAVAALIGARETGLNVSKAGRSIPSLIAALTRRTPDGQLADELTAVGITEEQSLIQRLQTIQQARAAGTISQGQFETSIGGAQNLRLVGPLLRAIETGAFERSRQALLDPNAAENTIAELQRNPFVRAQERKNVRDLLEQSQREFLSPRAEILAQTEAEFPQSGTARFFTNIGRAPQLINPGEQDLETQTRINQRNIGDLVGRSVDDALQGGQAPGINVTVNQKNVGQEYHTVNADGTNHQTESTGRSDLP